jgi:hypothetical protein
VQSWLERSCDSFHICYICNFTFKVYKKAGLAAQLLLLFSFNKNTPKEVFSSGFLILRIFLGYIEELFIINIVLANSVALFCIAVSIKMYVTFLSSGIQILDIIT